MPHIGNQHLEFQPVAVAQQTGIPKWLALGGNMDQHLRFAPPSFNFAPQVKQIDRTPPRIGASGYQGSPRATPVLSGDPRLSDLGFE